MKNKKTLLTIVLIAVPVLLLWLCIFLGKTTGESDSYFKYVKLYKQIFWPFLIMYIIGISWILYPKEWIKILGLQTQNITTKIVLKAFGVGMLIDIVCVFVVLIIGLFIFKELSNPTFFADNVHPVRAILLALLFAPIVEELFFRGFIIGIWQKLYTGKDNAPIKLIILVTALMFAFSHFGAFFSNHIKHFLNAFIPYTCSGIYFGWLRYKHKSIIPSMFAHMGSNLSSMTLAGILMVIFFGATGQFAEAKKNAIRAQYESDTIPYNFNPNDNDEWDRSFKKFVHLERQLLDEATEHLKGDATNAIVWFTIDTCGNIYNIYTDHNSDSIFHKKYGYDFGKVAVNFIKTLPQCAPYISDGKKEEKEMCESIPFY